MAKRTPTNENQLGLFGTDSPQSNEKGPRKPERELGRPDVAPRRYRAVNGRQEAQAHHPPNPDYQDACPWVPLTPEERADFEARFGRRVAKGGWRFELRDATVAFEQRPVMGQDGKPELEIVENEWGDPVERVKTRAVRTISGGRLVQVWRVRFES